MNLVRQRFILISLLCLSFALLGQNQREQARIQFLLNQIEKSDLRFERNGEVHSAKDAVSHLQMKWEKARNSWFAPPEEKQTAEMFIEEIGSKSSLSGKPYYVIFPDGRRMESRVWFFAELKKFSK